MELQRMTRQRKMILEELRRSRRHPTAAELYQVVRRRLPRISLGTVYRNLELLHRAGMIRKFSSAGKEARFDADLSVHFHIHCVRCGRTDDLAGDPAIQVQGDIIQPSGWMVKEERFEVAGVCPDCRAS